MRSDTGGTPALDRPPPLSTGVAKSGPVPHLGRIRTRTNYCRPRHRMNRRPVYRLFFYLLAGGDGGDGGRYRVGAGHGTAEAM